MDHQVYQEVFVIMGCLVYTMDWSSQRVLLLSLLSSSATVRLLFEVVHLHLLNITESKLKTDEILRLDL